MRPCILVKLNGKLLKIRSICEPETDRKRREKHYLIFSHFEDVRDGGTGVHNPASSNRGRTRMLKPLCHKCEFNLVVTPGIVSLTRVLAVVVTVSESHNLLPTDTRQSGQKFIRSQTKNDRMGGGGEKSVKTAYDWGNG